jgi:hypothetical protein
MQTNVVDLRLISRGKCGLLAAFVILAGSAIAGCSSTPPLTQSSFLGDYSRLRPDGENRMRYRSPRLKEYTSFIIDPVQMRSRQGKLSPEERSRVAAYFRQSLSKSLRERGYNVTSTPGARTARVRVAITNVQESTWWQKVHPASSLAGAGRGGAAMEGEVVDSVSGEQLAATVQAGVGSQFTVGNFSTVADLENVIDQWVKTACDRLDELRGSASR